MKTLFSVVLKILGTVLYAFSFLFPRSKKTWVFGAWNGDNYSDNSKYFFEYVNNCTEDINPIWITKNTDVAKSLKFKGYKAFHVNTLQGIFYCLRAKYGIISSGNKDLNQYLTGNMRVIQLWHGIPLKKIMYDDFLNQLETRYTKFLNWIFPYRKGKYSMLIATSAEVQDKMSSAFRVDKKYVKITGFPRNEAFSKTHENSVLFEEIASHRNAGKSIGIYLPTFRDNNPDSFINYIVSSFKDLDEKLGSINCIIYVKMHYMHLSFLDEKNIEFNNIRVIQDSEVNSDIYPILPVSDFLITDYSSIYFDYLLLNKPVVFFPFDFETYISASRELYYKYENVTPGAKAYNEKQLFSAISSTLTREDNYLKAREEILNLFHEKRNGNYSEKLYSEIIHWNI